MRERTLLSWLQHDHPVRLSHPQGKGKPVVGQYGAHSEAISSVATAGSEVVASRPAIRKSQLCMRMGFDRLREPVAELPL